jgi:5-amino-6-(5-phosphoribosylamino)uracil reductase
VDLQEMMRTLRRDFGVHRLVCEGGAQVFRSLVEVDLVDEINLTFCPRIFGSEQAPTLTGPAGAFLPASVQFQLEQTEVVEDECFVRYRRVRSGEREEHAPAT